MKKFIVIFFFAVFAKANAQDTTNTALLYGHNHSYYLSAPIGWIMDNASGREQGMTSVFYPKGSSWANGETVMYTTYINFDSTKNETIRDIITFDSAQFKTTSPQLKVSKLKPIVINKTKKAIVYSYSGDINGNYETVAYIPEKKGVVMIVISSSNKNGCTNNYKAFEALVRSYKFLTDKVNIE
jgi:hypothetical protein